MRRIEGEKGELEEKVGRVENDKIGLEARVRRLEGENEAGIQEMERLTLIIEENDRIFGLWSEERSKRKMEGGTGDSRKKNKS